MQPEQRSKYFKSTLNTITLFCVRHNNICTHFIELDFFAVKVGFSCLVECIKQQEQRSRYFEIDIRHDHLVLFNMYLYPCYMREVSFVLFDFGVVGNS